MQLLQRNKDSVVMHQLSNFIRFGLEDNVVRLLTKVFARGNARS